VIEGPVVLYGTMRMVAGARREPRIAPWVLDDYPALRCSSYYRWIYERLGRTSLLVPLSGLPHVDWARLLGDQVFIRPDSTSSYSTRASSLRMACATRGGGARAPRRAGRGE
jgi:hypothetical protein